MEEHVEKHIWNEKFRCTLCTYSAKRQLFIDQHLKKHHKAVTEDALANQPQAANQTPGLIDKEKLEIPTESR